MDRRVARELTSRRYPWPAEGTKIGGENNFFGSSKKSGARYGAIAVKLLNKRQGTNKHGKMAPIVAKTMDIDLDSAQELLKRLSRNTTVDMSCDKFNFAEERWFIGRPTVTFNSGSARGRSSSHFLG